MSACVTEAARSVREVRSMTKQRTRNLEMTFGPKVEANSYARTITVETGSWSGKTINKMKGEMSIYCAVRLIRDLRRALRQIRDEEAARLNRAVQNAEGDL